MVYRLALRTLRSQTEAEDATQEAFMRVHRSFDSFDPTRPLGPWIGRITYNVCLKRLGRVARQPLDADHVAIGRMGDERARSPERAAADRESASLVAEAVDSLSAQDRFLITLRYRDGYNDVEVAEATGMNVNTVRTRLFRARKALRSLLGPTLRRSDAGRG